MLRQEMSGISSEIHFFEAHVRQGKVFLCSSGCYLSEVVVTALYVLYIKLTSTMLHTRCRLQNVPLIFSRNQTRCCL